MPTRIQGKIKPLKKRVLVSNMHFGMLKTKSGVILPDNDGTAAGTHPRWAKVYATGPDQNDVEVGQWVLIAHGRWTRQVLLDQGEQELDVRMVDEKDILLMTDQEPDVNTITAPYKE
ncbi:MAG: co-chaperone GroES family protein [Candidatus Poseidoniales archaeon]|tara:strand:+ start:268 stop:618 length:351 start_codon:yes stop_codon:yes gene_type:complete